tara:strand:- start:114794 stop:115957 length:1164 start_codon:yes stop_codon:yes gene_type:complete
LFLEPGVTIIQGNNGNGKSNLLEAIYILSIGKSQRATNDRDLVRFTTKDINIKDESLGIHTKVLANVEKSNESTKIQCDLFEIEHNGKKAEPQQSNSINTLKQKHLKKLVRINGIKRKISEFVGEVNAVLFTVQDLELIYGNPKTRRRYLDVLISQNNREYLMALQRYQKTLLQRNHLLRSIKMGVSQMDELTPWDHHLVIDGGFIIYTRLNMIQKLSKLSLDKHHLLSPLKEKLNVIYITDVQEQELSCDQSHISSLFKQKLSASLNADVIKGFTTVGPHRDDFKITIDDMDCSRFASRGQGRTATLSLKLAEAEYLSDARGENPLILLDDVFSELDSVRRDMVWRLVSQYEQSLITTSDIKDIPNNSNHDMKMFQIVKGNINPIN